jgi:hypothetical protein
MTLDIRKTLTFSADMWAEINDFRWSSRINTESDVLRNLLMAGLHYYKLMQDPAFAQAESQAAERMAQVEQ